MAWAGPAHRASGEGLAAETRPREAARLLAPPFSSPGATARVAATGSRGGDVDLRERLMRGARAAVRDKSCDGVAVREFSPSRSPAADGGTRSSEGGNARVRQWISGSESG